MSITKQGAIRSLRETFSTVIPSLAKWKGADEYKQTEK